MTKLIIFINLYTCPSQQIVELIEGNAPKNRFKKISQFKKHESFISEMFGLRCEIKWGEKQQTPYANL